jgi:membrane-associated phospholipid phosphatase
MIRAENLKWGVPVGLGAAVLAQWVDVRASNRIRSEPFTTGTDDASNWLIGAQFGVAALTFLAGCASAREKERHAGFATMEAAAYGVLSDLALKAALNREYPDKFRGEGRFWQGGKSFPSAHAATSWAMAAAMAQQYERKRWVKWASYAAATGVTALRFTARKHFPSDLVVGGALGYLIGTSVGAGR